MNTLSAIRTFLALCFFASWLVTSLAQSSGNSASPTISLDVTTILISSSVATTAVSQSGNRNIPIPTVVPIVFSTIATNTVTITPTASASPTPAPIVLETKLDPAFGVLGALFIITGLPSAFWGHKNRWTSFFLIGFYTLSLVCVVLILKFGVLSAVNPPNKTLRGMFVLASAIAGVAGGAISVFFWKATKFFIGAWGGLAFGLWIQCFRNGGLINPVGLRWIMYIVCAVIGFVLCTIPKLHWHVLLVSTAFVGATAFMLGVDCFTTAGLKEFYIWNLGFRALFPKFVNNGIRFPVSQTMQIELGLLGAVALMGGAVQLRILAVLQRKLNEIAEEQKKRDEEAEIHDTTRFNEVSKEKDQWERDHPTLSKHGRQESGYESSTPLMKDGDTPSTDDKQSSTLTFGIGSRSRNLSGVSDFMAAPNIEDELRRAAMFGQSPGALPAMDLGLGIQDDVPRSFINDKDVVSKIPSTLVDREELARKEALLGEIQAVRRSIDALRSETPSSDSKSRRPSLSSKRTLSCDLGTVLSPQSAHLRPPRQADPRTRIQSMELDHLGQSAELGASIGRPTSAPLKDDWDAYVHDRKLLQPPSGVTQPIPTTRGTSRIAMPQAVAEALTQRKKRESALEMGERGRADSLTSDNVPMAELIAKKKNRPISNVPVAILPPRKAGSPAIVPAPQKSSSPRTATFEELTERHRQKMREMQAPLTQAEKEQADLEAAKTRWERSKDIEKSVVTKRQAEQAALYAKEDKKRKTQDDRERTGRGGKRESLAPNDAGRGEHHRSLSADKLVALGTSSRRVSTMKVENWVKDVPERAASTSKRHPRAVGPADQSPIPFPDHTRRDSARKANRLSGTGRDPPN